MRRYKSIYESKQVLFEWTPRDDWEYQKFCEYVISSNYGELLLEWKLFPALKEKIEFIKNLAIETGFKIKDLFKLFMDKIVFKFFKLIGWSFTELFSLIKKGYKAYQDFMKVIYEYIEKNNVVQWTKEHLLKLDSFLNKHPKTKRIAGIVLAALLIYMWTQMTFVGNPTYDFDLSMIIDSLTGKMTLSDIFGGTNGTIFLTLFITGSILGLSVPYPGSNLIKFTIGMLYTLAKGLKMKLLKGKESQKDVGKVIDEFS